MRARFDVFDKETASKLSIVEKNVQDLVALSNLNNQKKEGNV
jgi:hypothetical protein